MQSKPYLIPRTGSLLTTIRITINAVRRIVLDAVLSSPLQLLGSHSFGVHSLGTFAQHLIIITHLALALVYPVRPLLQKQHKRHRCVAAQRQFRDLRPRISAASIRGQQGEEWRSTDQRQHGRSVCQVLFLGPTRMNGLSVLALDGSRESGKILTPNGGL